MRRAPLALLLLLIAADGCAPGRLRQHTVKQGGTLPELQYQQVLDNLARFAGDPATLPWHVNLREGTAQITDSVSGGAAVDIGPPTETLPQLFGTRTAVAQWGMAPVVDATELRLLRYAYRRAVGVGERPDPEFLDELAHELKAQVTTNVDLQDESALFFGLSERDNPTLRDFAARVVTTNVPDFAAGDRPVAEVTPLARDVRRRVAAVERDLDRIQPGWFRKGSRRDVPRDARYVGRSGDCYVWVEADGREQLTEFTLTVLKFAELIKEVQAPTPPGSVKFSPGDRG